MSCKADLIPWLQLMNQLSIVSVDMTVVDRQIPQAPVSQLVRIVPLHRHTHIPTLPQTPVSQLVRIVPLHRHTHIPTLPQTPVSQLVRIVPLHRHTRILAGVLPPQFENTFLRFSKSKNATFYVFLKCRQKK